MLTLSWRRVGSSSTLALTLVVGLPALAQAQLFPNLYVQRKRADCANEPPFYGHVRRDYFGYYPTCWRKFPEGWGCPCPNPEVVDWEAAKVKQPRDKNPLTPRKIPWRSVQWEKGTDQLPTSVQMQVPPVDPSTIRSGRRFRTTPARRSRQIRDGLSCRTAVPGIRRSTRLRPPQADRRILRRPLIRRPRLLRG
jgi:hypothetical protein